MAPGIATNGGDESIASTLSCGINFVIGVETRSNLVSVVALGGDDAI
jgi:hypothetical protein